MIDRADLTTYVLIAFFLGFLAGFIDSEIIGKYIDRYKKK